MKTVGIVGGIGPESTIDYYRLLISRFREMYRTDDYPKILINSINMNKMLELVARPATTLSSIIWPSPSIAWRLAARISQRSLPIRPTLFSIN